MANPYASVSITSYNANPPTDDGAVTGANQIKWSTIKSKLSDPLNTAVPTIDSHITTAMGKLLGCGNSVPSAGDVTVVSADQGKTFIFTAAPHTLTLPDATVVASPFAFSVQNNSSGIITVAPATGQSINGLSANATIALGAGNGGIFVTDGSNFFYIGTVSGDKYASGVKTMFFTGAPTGWVVDSTINDAGIQLVSGAPGADAGSVAFSSIFTNITIAKANLPSYNLTVTDPTHIHTASSNCSGLVGGSQIQTGGSGTNNTSGQTITVVAASTGISVGSGGSGTALNFTMKTAQANRCTKS